MRCDPEEVERCMQAVVRDTTRGEKRREERTRGEERKRGFQVEETNDPLG